MGYAVWTKHWEVALALENANADFDLRDTTGYGGRNQLATVCRNYFGAPKSLCGSVRLKSTHPARATPTGENILVIEEQPFKLD